MATHSQKIPWTEEDYSPWGHKEWDLSRKDLSDGAQHKLCFNILIVCVGFVVVVVFFCDFLAYKDHSLSSSVYSEHKVQY